jgi:hypothetical protein
MQFDLLERSKDLFTAAGKSSVSMFCHIEIGDKPRREDKIERAASRARLAPELIGSSELRTVDVGDCVGDVPPVVRASPGALFDLDAICSASGEPVDDVLQAITGELLVWGRDVDCYV